MEFLPVEGGEFTMGDALGVGTAKERPAHMVSVSDFYLGRTEVTTAQFRAFADESGYLTEAERAGSVLEIDARMNTFVRREGLSWTNPGFEQTADSPAVWISWNDADAFVRWLAGKTGRPFRLPTEAEWEFAARQRGGALLWSGTNSDAEVGDYAWYALNSSAQTHPVGEKKPNSLGLFDMSGNSWEWCGDWQVPYRSSDQRTVDPAGPAQGKYKALRGGSWRVGSHVIRATYRNGYSPGYSHSSIGFRVALPRDGGL
jgi:formylglycine-generating enzyme required for sulfatase activity